MKITKAELKRLPNAFQARQLLGVWSNELNSQMNIKSVSGAAFSGDYTSKDANGNSVTGTLQGSMAGDTIGFIVNWQPSYDSVTSWAGKLAVDQSGKVYVNTLWLLASGDANLPIWQSISAGSDWFWKTN